MLFRSVLSRCLQFNLRPMPPEVVREHLAHVLQAEGVAFEAGALRLLGRAARGSMRDALSLTDQAIAFGAGQLDEAVVRSMLGTVDRSHASALVGALALRDGAAVLATVHALRQLGLSAAGTLEELASLLQQMAVEQAVPGALDETDPDSLGARTLAAELPADETQLLYSIVVHGRAELSLLSDEYAALTMVLLRLLAFAPAGGAPAASGAPRAAPLVAAARAARSTAPVRLAGSATPTPLPVPVPRLALPVALPEPSASPAPAPALAPMHFSPPAPVRVVSVQEPPPWIDDEVPDDDGLAAPRATGAVAAYVTAASTVAVDTVAASTDAAFTVATSAVAPSPLLPLVTSALGDPWAALIRPLVAAGSLAAMVRELALQAGPTALQALDGGGSCWTLMVERETLRAPALVAKLTALLETATGEPVQLRVQPGVPQDSIGRRDAQARDAAQRDAESTIENDPAVRALMAQFRTARIVPGSIKPVSADSPQPRTPRTPTP